MLEEDKINAETSECRWKTSFSVLAALKIERLVNFQKSAITVRNTSSDTIRNCFEDSFRIYCKFSANLTTFLRMILDWIFLYIYISIQNASLWKFLQRFLQRLVQDFPQEFFLGLLQEYRRKDFQNIYLENSHWVYSEISEEVAHEILLGFFPNVSQCKEWTVTKHSRI